MIGSWRRLMLHAPLLFSPALAALIPDLLQRIWTSHATGVNIR
jgi:hypothetical protein